jgi:hypothetical protein
VFAVFFFFFSCSFLPNHLFLFPLVIPFMHRKQRQHISSSRPPLLSATTMSPHFEVYFCFHCSHDVPDVLVLLLVYGDDGIKRNIKDEMSDASKGKKEKDIYRHFIRKHCVRVCRCCCVVVSEILSSCQNVPQLTSSCLTTKSPRHAMHFLFLILPFSQFFAPCLASRCLLAS